VSWPDTRSIPLSLGECGKEEAEEPKHRPLDARACMTRAC